MSSVNRSLLRRLTTGLLVSSLGASVAGIAIPLLVYLDTSNILAATLVFAANALPTAIFGLIGGAHADRFNRKQIVVVASLIAGVGYLVMPLGFALLGLPALLVTSLITRTALAYAAPAFRAALPPLLGAQFQDFTGKRASISFMAQILGPLLGGALVGLIGAPLTLVLTGVARIFYALVILSIRGFDVRGVRETKARAAKTLHSIKDGIRLAVRTPAIANMLIYWFLSLSAVPIAIFAAIPYVTTHLHQDALHYGIASACYAAGSLVSAYVCGKLHFPGSVRFWMVVAGCGYGLLNIVMLAQPGYIWFCVLWVAWGLAYGPEEVVSQVAFARVTSGEYSGRFYSLMSITMSLAAMVGGAVAGPIIVLCGPLGAMAVAGAIFLAATFYSFVFGPGSRIFARIPAAETH